ncbi:DUF1963 domain-containing protein [Streptomyces alanosinicus]|uniref:DUF1963 domain-containing protein n=1 Tax=Streptomyces alanosinicus TaxID=68171 RepID=A0A918YTS6_9ACTN|nr:DUF1963 domain-containing protein [Streptomyces alanosinicus]GHE14955.1 hypothetical protein GCM10010339_87980 [Streptomyces alanosinicus]
MIPARTLDFAPEDGDGRTRLSRLGGEPAWLDTPQWPLSSRHGEPMTFLAQFVVPGENVTTYLFMDLRGTRSWRPDAGQNALVLQPSGRIPPFITVVPLDAGPVLRDAAGHTVCHEARLTPFPLGADSTQHLGGHPNWLQGDEAPHGWTFLLQLDASQLRDAAVEFGDAGIGYAFVSPDRREGRFLWQSA